MKQPQPLPRADLLDLKSILLRAAIQAERTGRIERAALIAEQITAIENELADQAEAPN